MIAFVDHSPACSGRTTRLMQLAAKEWLYMVCVDKRHQERVFHEAIAQGLKIPYPITFDDFLHRRFFGRGIRGFVIDNADLLLEMIANGVPVRAVSMLL